MQKLNTEADKHEHFSHITLIIESSDSNGDILFSLSKQNLQKNRNRTYKKNNTKTSQRENSQKRHQNSCKVTLAKPAAETKKESEAVARFIKVWMEWSIESNWAANCSVSKPRDEQFVCRMYTNNARQMFKIYLTVTNSSTERYGHTIYSYRYYDIKRGIAVECLPEGLLILLTFMLPINQFL